MSTLELKANDEVTEGRLTLTYTIDRGCISPLGLTFSRTHNGKVVKDVGFNLSSREAKQLAKFIIENL
jgi:hypothetical protein